jgi:tripartite ATP-independent transporter DctM subunit
MDPISLASVAIAGMFILILMHVPIGVSMGAIGFIGVGLFTGFKPALTAVAAETVTAISSVNLAVIPLFLLMGNFASAAGISTDMYNLANGFLGRFRGGIAMATIGGCGLFGAVCGSSFATTATFGRVALPEMIRRDYSPSLATGCIAGGGTLGSLVPPSIILVIYAIMAEQSIIELFIAAIVPAILTIILYFLAIMVYVRINREAGPAGDRVSAQQLMRITMRSWGAIFLLVVIAGGIYGGVFTVTEAASLGAIVSFLLAVIRKKMNVRLFWEALTDTATTTAMIYTIIIGAGIFNYFIVLSHMPEVMTRAILGSGWPVFIIFIVLLFVYIILGSVFDTVAAMVITLPFVLPLIVDMGYSPVWWGIVNVVVIEIGMITPPIGINVFVLQGVSRHYPLSTIYKGIIPFLSADVVRLAVLVLFPILSLWLLNFFR